MKAVTFSVRMEDELHEVVTSLKEEKSLGLLIRVLLKAIKHDRATTLSFLLGLSDSSLNNSRILENTLRTTQLINYKESGSTLDFQGYLKEIGYSQVGDFGNGLNESDVQELLLKFKSDLVGEVKPIQISESDTNQNLENIVEMCVEKILARGVSLPVVETKNVNLDTASNLKDSIEKEEEKDEEVVKEPTSIVSEITETLTPDEVEEESDNEVVGFDANALLAGLNL